MTLRVVIADDNPSVRQSFSHLLRTLPGVSLLAEAADGQEALDLALLHRPDVILMDISMPHLDGFEATRQIRLHAPEVRVVIMTADSSPEYLNKAVELGAAGFVVKTAAATAIPQALEAVVRGERFYGRER
jgi:DNA-binding NarL/FixJ family response regulator